MTKAVIFDLDGVLVDSEPLWDITLMSAFNTVGIHLTREMCMETRGFRADYCVNFWAERFPGKIKDKKRLEELINRTILKVIKDNIRLKEGAEDALDFVLSKRVKRALASASPLLYVRTVISTLKLQEYFEVVHSGELEQHSKPFPDIYLTTVKTLGVNPSDCVAFEDSPAGVASAKSAGLICVAIPHHIHAQNESILSADFVISSLSELDDRLWRKICAG